MTFVRAQLNSFNYNFKTPLTFKGHTTGEKEGYFLNLFDQKGNLGIGELSPLIGFSKKDLKEAKNELSVLLPNILDQPFNIVDLDFSKPFFNLFDIPDKTNSNVLFCLEGALLSWLETTHPKLIKDFFKVDDFNFSVPLNGLLISDENLDQNIESWKTSGIKNIKIKVGRRSIKDELSLIWKVFEKTHGKVKLRLDANCSFDSEDFRFFAKNLPLNAIDYVEDPLIDIKQINTSISGFKVPLAIDEKLLDLKDEEIPFVSTWVLKPSLIGGYSKAIELIQEGAKRDIKTVISSSFDTNLSLKYLGLLAAYQNSFEETPCGLDTFRAFIDDKDKTPHVREGNIQFT